MANTGLTSFVFSSLNASKSKMFLNQDNLEEEKKGGKGKEKTKRTNKKQLAKTVNNSL